MRIALFTETFLPATDGVVTRLQHTVEELGLMGDEVAVFAPRAKGQPSNHAGAEVFGFAGVPFPPYPQIRIAPPHPGVIRALERFGPDLIHVVNPVVLGMAGMYYARRHKVPLVASYHTNIAAYARYYKLGFLEGFARSVTRAIHNQADVNLCTSDATRRYLVEQGIRKVRLWPQGVDSNLFDPGKATNGWREWISGGEAEKHVLIFVGRLAPEKNIGMIRAVLESLPDTRLAILGDGPAREEIEHQFSDTDTIFTGVLHGEDLAGALSSADAFVFPSTTETLGMAMIEALASGVPVLAARSGASDEVVEDGVNGLLFEAGSEKDLIAKTRKVLEEPDLRDRLSRNARLAAERRDWAAATRGLRGFYEEARLGGGKPR